MAQNEPNSMMDQGLDALLYALELGLDPVNTLFQNKTPPGTPIQGYGSEKMQNLMNTNYSDSGRGLVDSGKALPPNRFEVDGNPDSVNGLMRFLLEGPVNTLIQGSELAGIGSLIKKAGKGALKSKFLNNQRGNIGKEDPFLPQKQKFAKLTDRFTSQKEKAALGNDITLNFKKYKPAFDEMSEPDQNIIRRHLGDNKNG